MTMINANVSAMFSSVEPAYCSGSQSELGDSASRITWSNALAVAEKRGEWLVSGVHEACDAMRDWARESGGWTREEVDGWTKRECLALFVQNVASEIRGMGCDDCELIECIDRANSGMRDRNGDCEFTCGSYDVRNGEAFVQFYAGI